MKRHARLIQSIIVLLACLAIYGQTAGFSYLIYDDFHHVERPHLVDGFQFSDIAAAAEDTSTNLWHPVTWLSFHADAYFGSPAASHLFNLLLHCAGSILLLLVLARIPATAGFALLVALIHAIHPVHVESVAWISARKDLLAFFFSASCLWFFLNTVKQDQKGSYLLALASCLLALCSKPSAVTLPAILFAADFAVRHTDLKKRILTQIPFGALVIAVTVTSLAIHFQSGNAELEVHATWWQRVGIACWNTCHYIVQFFVPRDLTFFHPYPEALSTALLITCIVLVGVVVVWLLSLLVRGRLGVASTGFSLYLITFAPMSGILIASDAIRADRYLFVPYVFLGITVGAAISSMIKRLDGAPSSRLLPKIATCSVIIWLVVLGFLGHRFTTAWKTDEHLCQRALKIDPTNYLAWHNLGTFQLQQDQSESAIESFENVLSIEPSYKNSHLGIAEALTKLDRPSEAEPYYRRELDLHPSEKSIHAIAAFLFDQSKYRDCQLLLESTTIEIAERPLLLALCLHQQGKAQEALLYYGEATCHSDATDEALINHALCLIQLKELQTATSLLDRVRDRTSPRFLTILRLIECEENRN